MFYFLKNIFKKRPYTILGRGGISYREEGKEFYIDTNNFLEGSYGIQIFYTDIRSVNSEQLLDEKEKKRIASRLKELLEKDGTRAEIFPM